MGLTPEIVATQVVQRDHHAEYITTLGVIAGTLAQIALEVRHLQRTEVREAEEYFSPKQKGSSAMPHKRNPVKSERICGMARLVQGYALPALKYTALARTGYFPFLCGACHDSGCNYRIRLYSGTDDRSGR